MPFRLIQKREETRTLKIAGTKITKGTKGGVDIDQLYQSIRSLTGSLLARGSYNHRCKHGIFKIRVLAPDSVFTHLMTMVAPKDDCGAVCQPKPIQFTKHASQLSIHVTD